MADTNFTDKVTVIPVDWANDVNDVAYTDCGGVGGLSSTDNGKGASLIGIEDAAGNFTATTVEAALAEQVSNLASTSNGKGLSLIGLEDANGDWTATDGEALAAEIADSFDGTIPITPDINGGSIDGTPIGQTTPAAGSFTDLDVSANSSGNVSRWVMETALATATQYATLATIGLGSADDSDVFAQLLLTSGEGDDICTALINVYATQTTLIDSTESKIQVLSISDTTNVNYDDFFLTASATTKGTDIILSMQSKTAVKWYVQEISRRISDNVDATTPISYSDGATWSATDPTSGAAVAITSDWAGSGTFVPVAAGGTTPGVGTYSTQLGEEINFGGKTTFVLNIAWSAHTGTGNLIITGLPRLPKRVTPLSVYYDGLTVGSGKTLTAYVDTSGNILLKQSDPAGGAATLVAMDTSIAYLSISGEYINA